MNIKSLFSCFLIISLCSPAFSQKIKYKELFVLLNNKQYEDAEPFLKKFLKEETDNPNAYLFMGLIYQDKADKQDVLKATEKLISFIDSAVFFFGKANGMMTEKEVSKHKEYYQMFNRRDIRTGEFGVNLSDVKLLLETRMKIKDRIPLIRLIKSNFISAESYYTKSQKVFLGLQGAYPGMRELYLRADDSLILQLNRLSHLYDSAHITFNDYKGASLAYGKTGYNQDLNPTEIKDFKKEGATTADFYKDDLVIWDYKRWALSSVEVIEKEIKPLNDQLVAHDKAINTLHQRLKKDSVSVSTELAMLRTKAFESLVKVDAQALPLKVFEMKEAELEYGSLVVEHRPIRDSANLVLQSKALAEELTAAKKIDSLGGLLVARNMAEDIKNYRHFISTAYGPSSVLMSQIKTTHDFGVREVGKREAELKRKSESLKWIINDKDSIPLFQDNASKSRFKPVFVKEELYTAGLQFADTTASGYFYTITPTRRPALKATFPVDTKAFTKRNVPFTKGLGLQDERGHIYFIILYSEVKTMDKYPATIVKIYQADGLAWSVNISFAQLPEDLVLSADTGELTVKTRSQAGDIIPVVLDKNGKEIK